MTRLNFTNFRVAVLVLSSFLVGSGSAIAEDESAAERAQALKLDLEEAVQMLKDRKLLLFKLDFLPGGGSLGMSSRRRTSSSDEKLLQLMGVLQAAIKTKPTFNRTRTLAQIDCVVEPTKLVEEKSAAKGEIYGEVQGSSEGFGSNLSNAMFAAAGTLDSGNLEKFVRGMYPLKELGRVTQGDQLKRLIFRLTQNPEMVKAMIRDLQQVANSKAVSISSAKGEAKSVAMVGLPPAVRDGKPREYRFELVDGNWRFFDSQRESRKEHTRLMSAPVAGYTIPGRQITLLMSWQGDSWKLIGEPSERPIP